MRQGEIFLAGGSDPGLFLIGQNSRGQWVARDQRGLRGGLFVSHAAASNTQCSRTADGRTWSWRCPAISSST